MKITFPETITGQDGWEVYVSQPVPIYPPDTRKWYHKAIHRILMWAHGKVESLGHWLYYTSRRFDAPGFDNSEPISYNTRSFRLGVYDRDGNEIKLTHTPSNEQEEGNK